MTTIARTEVEVGEQCLGGLLSVPADARGLVLFAHGSGSSRFSPRNTEVADRLNLACMATLLFDLLTPTEAEDRSLVFDIPLLGSRVSEAIGWARSRPDLGRLPIGLFGASTGAAAALVAAAEHPTDVAAVVSRGGRPDLAVDALAEVRAPTLLVVGGRDTEVIALNETAFSRLGGEKHLALVPGATHLFEEPGTLDEVVELASEWFLRHFPASS